jgi:pilus assembly protein Flp/PilA
MSVQSVALLMAGLRSRRGSERGASAVEYGLLVAAIAAVIIVIVFALGNVIQEAFTDTCDTIRTETPVEAACE